VYTIFNGVVQPGFQFASGQAIGREKAPSPFARGTLEMQHPHFKARGFDLEAEVPGLFWGTINIKIDRELVLAQPDRTLELVDWTAGAPGAQIPPETFSFIRCCVAFGGRYHLGLIYYPHPETKGPTNAHRYDALEVVTERIEGIGPGSEAAVFCRENAFRHR
jgi:hypothetical protein